MERKEKAFIFLLLQLDKFKRCCTVEQILNKSLQYTQLEEEKVSYNTWAGEKGRLLCYSYTIHRGERGIIQYNTQGKGGVVYNTEGGGTGGKRGRRDQDQGRPSATSQLLLLPR